MDTIRAFFPKSGHFRFSKRAGEAPLLSDCTSVSVMEYASIPLNILKYPWKCLNKLFWLYQGSEYAWSSYIFDRLLKMSRVLNVPGFWMWQSCICRGYTELWKCLNMGQYASMMPEYTSIFLNMAEYCWMSLSMPENAWINCSNYARVLSMPHHLRYLTGFWICFRY